MSDARDRSRSPRRADPVDVTAPDPEEKLMRVDATIFDIEKETSVAVAKLHRARDGKVREALKERAAILKEGAPQPGLGTPGFPDFWYTALMHSNVEEYIYDVDEPVLKALQDITCEWLDEQGMTGFKLTFHFVENDFFTNSTLSKTYTTEAQEELEPDEVTCIRIDADTINWKPGKDVTVTGKKKNKPVSSFFREFMWNLGEEHPTPEDLEGGVEAEDSDDEDEDEEEAVARVMEEDYDTAVTIRDHFIQHAMRYYTGEMCEEEDSDEEEEDSDEDSDEEEDSDEDSD